jgi:hypothetical protein
MDLERETESLLLVKELGQCGLMGKIHLMMMDLEANKLMESIHSLLFSQQFQENILESSSETRMHSLQLSSIKMMEEQHCHTLLLEALSKYTSFGKVLLNR